MVLEPVQCANLKISWRLRLPDVTDENIQGNRACSSNSSCQWSLSCCLMLLKHALKILLCHHIFFLVFLLAYVLLIENVCCVARYEMFWVHCSSRRLSDLTYRAAPAFVLLSLWQCEGYNGRSAARNLFMLSVILRECLLTGTKHTATWMIYLHIQVTLPDAVLHICLLTRYSKYACNMFCGWRTYLQKPMNHSR